MDRLTPLLLDAHGGDEAALRRRGREQFVAALVATRDGEMTGPDGRRRRPGDR